MGFLSDERASSVQNKSLNLKQTPADIWEYDDANKTSPPTLRLKEGWEIETGYTLIFGGTPSVTPEDLIFGGTP